MAGGVADAVDDDGGADDGAGGRCIAVETGGAAAVDIAVVGVVVVDAVVLVALQTARQRAPPRYESICLEWPSWRGTESNASS